MFTEQAMNTFDKYPVYGKGPPCYRVFPRVTARTRTHAHAPDILYCSLFNCKQRIRSTNLVMKISPILDPMMCHNNNNNSQSGTISIDLGDHLIIYYTCKTFRVVESINIMLLKRGLMKF